MKCPSWEVDIVDLIFGNPKIVVIILFEETMFNIPVGGCWNLILDPMMFEVYHSAATDIPKFPLNHSWLYLI